MDNLTKDRITNRWRLFLDKSLLKEDTDHFGAPLPQGDTADRPPLDEAANLEYEKYGMYINSPNPHFHTLMIFDKQMLADELLEEGSVTNAVRGMMIIGASDHVGIDVPCYSKRGNPDSVYEIYKTVAEDKLGPMLYDAGLVHAKISHAVGVISDRRSVSDEAQKMYNNWLSRKSGATGLAVKARPFTDASENDGDAKPSDCEIHDKKDPAVNYLYSAITLPKFYFQLKQEGQRWLSVLERDTNFSKDEIESFLLEAGESLFLKKIK